MEIHSPDIPTSLKPTPERVAELDRLGDEIAELSAHLEAATARLLDLIREFDARGGWGNGFRSCAHWLSWRIGLDLGAAREKVRVARALGNAAAPGPGARPRGAVVRQGPGPDPRRHPGDRSAAARGGARRHGLPRRADRARLALRGPQGRGPGDQATAREPGAARPPGRRRHRGAPGATGPRGRARCSCGRWPRPARSCTSGPGARRAAPRLADPIADRPTMAQQQADALALLAEAALHHELDPGAPGERYQVVVHVDAAALADPDQPGQSVLEDGQRVSAETSRRLACDASRVVMRHDEEGRTVEVGARTRTIPPALRRALHHRDQGCRFPGCGLPFGQGHHVRHWAQGGPTTLSNLAMLCRRHHRAVHEEGYQVDRQPDGELRFRRPDGRLLLDVPAPAAVPADPVQALRAQHDAQGLRLARAHNLPVLAGRAPGSGLRDRRPASAGQPTPGASRRE